MFENIHFTKRKGNTKIPSVIILVFFLFGSFAMAQERLSFDEVVRLAESSNLEIKQSELNTVYFQKNV